MKRRDILKYTAYATGAAVSSPLWNSILSGAVEKFINSIGEYTPLLLSETQFALAKELADTILPKTESPSASEVRVPETIDSMADKVYSKSNQQAFLAQFTLLEKYLNSATGGNVFTGLDNEKRLDILRVLESPASSVTGEVRSAYLELKQQIISYYLSSEEIAENHLNYLPVPGYYNPCISLDEVDGKAWAIT